MKKLLFPSLFFLGVVALTAVFMVLWKSLHILSQAQEYVSINDARWNKPPMPQKSSVDIHQPSKEDPQPTPKLTTLSQERVDEIVNKILHSNSEYDELLEGVTQEEYGLAVRMKTAQMNHTADGKNEPLRGNVMFAFLEDPWTKEFQNLAFYTHWEKRVNVFSYPDLNEKGEVVDKRIPLNFWTSKKCIEPSDLIKHLVKVDEKLVVKKTDVKNYTKRFEGSCKDFFVPITAAGGVGDAQIYGSINKQKGWLDVSMAVFGSIKNGLEIIK